MRQPKIVLDLDDSEVHHEKDGLITTGRFSDIVELYILYYCMLIKNCPLIGQFNATLTVFFNICSRISMTRVPNQHNVLVFKTPDDVQSLKTLTI